MSAAMNVDWPDRLFDAFKRADIRQVGYVPDAGHARLIERCQADPDIRAVPLTTEEEGIALAAGAWLGGERAALLMQSSGVGNCVNMLSLARTCRFPLPIFITMRGEWEEFNPWQEPMGSIVEPGLGSTTWDLAAAGDDPRNFYLWGAMGGAAMIGLGLALAQPGKRVAVITGDGEMLMGMGSLATIGVQKPTNMAVIVFDNGMYGETGGGG